MRSQILIWQNINISNRSCNFIILISIWTFLVEARVDNVFFPLQLCARSWKFQKNSIFHRGSWECHKWLICPAQMSDHLIVSIVSKWKIK